MSTLSKLNVSKLYGAYIDNDHPILMFVILEGMKVLVEKYNIDDQREVSLLDAFNFVLFK